VTAARARVADVVAALDRRWPLSWAFPWDHVGLAVGDPAAEVSGVFCTLDPTPRALREAVASGCDLLLTHHPALLEPIETLVPRAGMAGMPFAAAASGVALVNAHTNLDRAPEGADALPLAAGLAPGVPLERGSVPVAYVVTYAPADAVDRVSAAMHTAGAGRVGQYEGCAFNAEGQGRFTAMAGSAPNVGETGAPATEDEVRIEVVSPRAAAPDVMAAVRSAHPYEEPVILAVDGELALGAARMGRLCEAGAGSTLGSLARQAATRFRVTPRVWGPSDLPVRLVATAPGSGRGLVADALAGGADVMLTGELRYHDALDALASGLAVIECGHDATEWPYVPLLADLARSVEGIDPRSVVEEKPVIQWWTP
jgi:dinuclear metal center YbgI/SA1388 family protein